MTYLPFSEEEYWEMQNAFFPATETESCREYARNAGMDDPDRAWINTPQDTWERNPFYHGPAVPHPEDDDYDSEVYGPFRPSQYADGEIPY